MDYSFAAQNVSSFAEIVPHVRLRADPIEVAPDSLLKIDLRFIADSVNTIRRAGEMPHFARPKFAVNLRLDFNPKRVADTLRLPRGGP